MRYIRFDHEICVYSYSQYSLKVHYMHIHNETNIVNIIYELYKTIWATVNIWYIAPSHQCLKSVLSFFRFWYTSKCYRFFKSVLSFFQAPAQFQKKKMSRILLSINLNFGCSSYNITVYSTFISPLLILVGRWIGPLGHVFF